LRGHARGWAEADGIVVVVIIIIDFFFFWLSRCRKGVRGGGLPFVRRAALTYHPQLPNITTTTTTF
jgi:hypothetical protein